MLSAPSLKRYVTVAHMSLMHGIKIVCVSVSASGCKIETGLSIFAFRLQGILRNGPAHLIERQRASLWGNDWLSQLAWLRFRRVGLDRHESMLTGSGRPPCRPPASPPSTQTQRTRARTWVLGSFLLARHAE